jgi:hypothetical protein
MAHRHPSIPRPPMTRRASFAFISFRAETPSSTELRKSVLPVAHRSDANPLFLGHRSRSLSH